MVEKTCVCVPMNSPEKFFNDIYMSLKNNVIYPNTHFPDQFTSVDQF